MNNKFAKLLELENGAQVLLTKERTAGEEVRVVLRTDVNEQTMIAKYYFKNDKSASLYMQDFTISNATKFNVGAQTLAK
jgi:hypothetical protein